MPAVSQERLVSPGKTGVSEVKLFGAGRKTSHFSMTLCMSALFMAVVASVSVASHGPPANSRPASSEGVRNKRTVQWVVLGHPRKGRVRIGNNFGWCPDTSRAAAPRIIGVKQTNRQDRVTLTAYLASGDTSHCVGVEAFVERVVHIRGGLRGRALFDGSQSPPVRRWPRRAAP
jgi:hypothetical protein